MRKYDEHPVHVLIRHCQMYLYGAEGSPELLFNEIAQDFYSFATLHLACTMFITTDSSEKIQGIFHRILDPLDKSDLLLEVDAILDSKLGNTTVRQFLRSKRNKLAVHGNVAFSSQPFEVQEVSFNKKSLMQYSEAMIKLDNAIYKLKKKLDNYASELAANEI